MSLNYHKIRTFVLCLKLRASFLCARGIPKKGTIVNVITKGVMYKMNTRSQDIYINNDNLNYSAKQFQALIGGVLGPVFGRCCGKVFV